MRVSNLKSLVRPEEEKAKFEKAVSYSSWLSLCWTWADEQGCGCIESLYCHVIDQGTERQGNGDVQNQNCHGTLSCFPKHRFLGCVFAAPPYSSHHHQSPSTIHPIPCDLSKLDTVENLVKEAEEKNVLQLTALEFFGMGPVSKDLNIFHFEEFKK